MTTKHGDLGREELQRRLSANERAMADSERQMAYLNGKIEATWAATPRDEELIRELMETTGADRERVVAGLQAKADQEIARLREQHPEPGPAPADPTDPAVRRLRELIG